MKGSVFKFRKDLFNSNFFNKPSFYALCFRSKKQRIQDYSSNHRAYDEIHLDESMIRLGNILEYACFDCGYDSDSFWKMFIHSGIARNFGIGDASVIAKKSGPEIARMVLLNDDNIVSYPAPAWR